MRTRRRPILAPGFRSFLLRSRGTPANDSYGFPTATLKTSKPATLLSCPNGSIESRVVMMPSRIPTRDCWHGRLGIRAFTLSTSLNFYTFRLPRRATRNLRCSQCATRSARCQRSRWNHGAPGSVQDAGFPLSLAKLRINIGRRRASRCSVAKSSGPRKESERAIGPNLRGGQSDDLQARKVLLVQIHVGWTARTGINAARQRQSGPQHGERAPRVTRQGRSGYPGEESRSYARTISD